MQISKVATAFLISRQGFWEESLRVLTIHFQPKQTLLCSQLLAIHLALMFPFPLQTLSHQLCVLCGRCHRLAIGWGFFAIAKGILSTVKSIYYFCFLFPRHKKKIKCDFVKFSFTVQPFFNSLSNGAQGSPSPFPLLVSSHCKLNGSTQACSEEETHRQVAEAS